MFQMKQLPSWLPLSVVLKYISAIIQLPAELNLHTCCVAAKTNQQSTFGILPSRDDMDFV